MLVGRMIQDQVGDDADVACVGSVNEILELLQRPVVRVHAIIVGNIIAIIFERGSVKRQQLNAGDPHFLEIVQLLRGTKEIADTILVAIGERTDV